MSLQGKTGFCSLRVLRHGGVKVGASNIGAEGEVKMEHELGREDNHGFVGGILAKRTLLGPIETAYHVIFSDAR